MSGTAETLAKLSSAAAKRLGIPADVNFYSPFPFAGMNQQDARTALEDQEFFWVENFILTGKASLRTLWDKGPTLYTATTSRRIVWFAWYNLGPVYYVAVFLDDGTAVQVRQSDGAITTISNVPGTFYRGGQLPFAIQSGAQYLLICNNNTTNDYWIWDGTVLFQSGSIGPTVIGTLTSGGSGYTSVPNYTVYGGSGSGVVLTPVIANGSVVRLNVDNPGTGYTPGNIVQVAFSGGGSDTGPILEAVITASTIQHITLVSGGLNYPTGTFPLGFTGGGGSGAAGTFTTADGSVTSITLTAEGGGYTSAPTISFPIPGTGATITATLAATAVNALIIGTGGSGYVPGTYPLSFSGGGGSGAQATYTVNASGVVASTTLVAGGTGYGSPPTVALPTGSGATAVALVNQGSVTSVTIINGGSGLTGTPLLAIIGGGGSGATAIATVTSGAISAVTVTAGGNGYQSAPAVEVSTGYNNAAAAILEVMPFGISGTSMETFLSRIWMSSPKSDVDPKSTNGLVVSAPGSLTDFATSDGGLLFSNSSRFQRVGYTALHQSNGYLYPLSDSSVDVISNVQTAGTPPTTTFNYQNTSAQIGAAWRDSVQDFGQSVIFANENGIQGLYGGSVRRVSEKINDIFVRAFPRDPTTGIVTPLPNSITPSGAVANLYTIPVYLLLVTLIDPSTQEQRNVMIGWNEKSWMIASQTTDLTFIATQEKDSVNTAWGTNGTSLFPLFGTPSATLTKKLVTKLYGGEREMIERETLAMYYRAQDKSVGQVGVALIGTMEATGFNTQVGSYPPVAASNIAQNPINPNFSAPIGSAPSWGGQAANAPGTAIGATITSTSPDFLLSGISIAYRELAAYFG